VDKTTLQFRRGGKGRLPPAKLHAGQRNNGDNKHQNGAFFHEAPPGAAYPPTKNQPRKMTAIIKITTGKRIPNFIVLSLSLQVMSAIILEIPPG
jgi:hypothetical protein